MPNVALPNEELHRRLGWFIRVRWLFLAGLAVAILSGRFAFRVEFPAALAALVGAVVLAYNLALLANHQRLRERPLPDLHAGRFEAGLQIALDLVALTVLNHFAGGAESPFTCFYLFHAIVGSMLMSKRDAWLVGLSAFALFSAGVILEAAGIIAHHDPTGVPEVISRHAHLPYLVVASAAFLATLFSTIYITTSIVDGLRMREAQLVLAKEKLVVSSRDLESANTTLTEKQRQLVQAAKQASLGQLVAGIAHEINNPVQFIHGNMTVLAEAFSDVLPLLDERYAADPTLRVARLDYPFFRSHVPLLLEDMADGAARIGAIVRDLKTFARKDEGRLDESVDLNEAVHTSLRLLHNQLKRFAVEEDLEPELPRLRGSRTQIQQVVLNTLENAAQSLGQGGHIRIRTRNEQDTGRVRLSIEDDGTGIAPEVEDKIFDPFFTTRQRTGGTGLGLSITYGIIQQHGGQIEVDTQVGEGTVFHFLLPVERSGAECAS